MKTLHLILLVFCSVCLVAQAAVQADVASFRQHAQQRNQELNKAGYNFDFRCGVGKYEKPGNAHCAFVVPSGGAEQQLLFWVETNGGEARFLLVGPDEREVVSWSGKHGEQVVVQSLRPGKHRLEIDSTGVDAGQALFCLKGNVVVAADLDPRRFQEIPASSADGFYWPYILFIPEHIKYPSLFVVPNNTGFATEDMDVLRGAASNDIKREAELAERLGCPLLVPMFPRPPMKENDNLYLHALSRESMLTTVVAWKRVDLQLLQMVRNAQLLLGSRGIRSDGKLLLWGFSAAGSFVNRFAVLHPEHVLAVAGGGVGWPIAPVGEIEQERLRYPVGCSDLETFTGKPFDPVALRAVKWFLFRGGDDGNDPVRFRDCYSETDAEVIRRRFGQTPIARWPQAQRLYSDAQLNAQLVLYPGVGHTWTPAIREDIAQFFEKSLWEAIVEKNEPLSK